MNLDRDFTLEIKVRMLSCEATPRGPKITYRIGDSALTYELYLPAGHAIPATADEAWPSVVQRCGISGRHALEIPDTIG